MTRRVIYSTSGLQEWVDLALRFRVIHGWEPCYWIAPPQLEDKVRQVFPDAVIHPVFDAVIGSAPAELSQFSSRPLNAQDLARFAKYEARALQMMDRHDPGGAFAYHERHRFFLQQVMYWLKVVKSISPDVVTFTESPHFASHFTLYAVCVEEGVPTVMFAQMAPFNRVTARARIEDLPLNLDAEYAEAIDATCNGRFLLAPDIEEQVSRISGDYSQAEPWYMRYQRQGFPMPKPRIALLPKLMRIRRWPQYAQYARRILTRLLHLQTTSERYYLKVPGQRMADSRTSSWQWVLYSRRARQFRRRLKARYASLSIHPVPGETYVYVALHYQPERTSVPEGGEFGDQWLLVNLLAHAVPEGWHVYVKEHPSQFSDKLQGNKGRTPDYYDELLQIKNVRLISLSVDPFRLIDEAQAVATLTGTAGWESILRGTPVLVFGEAWYRACEGAFTVRSLQDCQQAIAQIRHGYSIDQGKVRAYLKAMEQLSVVAYLGPTTAEAAGLSPEENTKSLIQALESYLKAAGLEQRTP